MKVSANKAAEMTGKSVQTITRACAKGKISHEKTDNGGYLIDVSELTRVYPMKPANSSAPPAMENSGTPNDLKALEVEIKGLHDRLADKDSTIAKLWNNLDEERAERNRLHALLTDQRAIPAPVEAVEPPRRRWWSFGRAND